MPPAVEGALTGGRLILAALFTALLAAAFLVARPAAPSIEEATLSLQAASLASDLDLVYGAEDIARFRGRGWAPDTRIALGFDLRAHRFDRPLPYALLIAPFEALLPGRGALLANVLLLAIAALVAVRHLTPVMGEGAPWLVAAALFGSTVAGHALAVRPEALLLAAAVAAVALAWPRAEDTTALDPRTLPAMYPGRPGEVDGEDEGTARPRRRLSLGRWLLVAALLALLALYHPLFLILAPALLAGVPRSARSVAVPVVALGVVALLAVAWLATDLWPEFRMAPKLALAADDLESLAARGASPAGGVDVRAAWPPPLADYRLHGLNLLYLTAGRHIGLLVSLLPALLLAWLGAGGAPLRRVLSASIVAVLLLLAFFPFDLAGGAPPGNRWLLPFYAALCLVPRRPVRTSAAVFFLLAGGALLAPTWLGRAPTEDRWIGRALEWLPFEATQRGAPVAAEVARRGARVRAASAAVGAGRDGYPLTLERGRRGEIAIASDRPVQRIELEFGANAVGQPVIGGAELIDMVFRPDGGVTFRLEPGGGMIHRSWWSESPQYHYRIVVAMPDTPLDLPFGVSVE